MLEFLLGAVVAFLILWAAVYSGTKAALRSFFGRDYYRDADDRRNEDANE